MIEHEDGAREIIQDKAHYPYVTRSLIRLFNRGDLTNVSDVVVEPRYGYVSRIQYNNGTFRVTYGNDLGLNTGAAEDLAKDKGYTKFMLRSVGVKCPRGEEFLLPWWADTIRPSQENRGNSDIKTTDSAETYVNQELGYPVYIKPVSGSKGGDVYRVENDQELIEIIAIYEEKKIRLAVVEEAILMPDYRIVVLDGELISAYERRPLAVVGNGTNTIEELVATLQESYKLDGRDTLLEARAPRIVKHLGKQGLSLGYVPAVDERLTLATISNLSAGGTSFDVSKTIAPRWVDVASNIAASFNLRLCGVDLACEDISSDAADYSVLEVNSTPGLDHYASSGDDQRRIVDDLYTRVLNVPPVS